MTLYNRTPNSENSGRRPSLPETNSTAGQTCVRNVVEINKTPNAATTQYPPKPKGQSGETREEKERVEA